MPAGTCKQSGHGCERHVLGKPVSTRARPEDECAHGPSLRFDRNPTNGIGIVNRADFSSYHSAQLPQTVLIRQPKNNALATAAPPKREHQSGLGYRRPPARQPKAERTMPAARRSGARVHCIEIRFPDQRTIGENPEWAVSCFVKELSRQFIDIAVGDRRAAWIRTPINLKPKAQRNKFLGQSHPGYIG